MDIIEAGGEIESIKTLSRLTAATTVYDGRRKVLR